MADALTARLVAAGEPPAAGLIAAMVAELDGLYGPLPPGAGGFAVTAADFGPPHGAFVVVFDGDRAVAGGGVRTLADGLGEVKRMYVVPDARGRGVARRLLAELEAAARRCGHRRLRLDTGPDQPHARRLYESEGYVAIPDYNGNPRARFWGEKRLA